MVLYMQQHCAIAPLIMFYNPACMHAGLKLALLRKLSKGG